jgi:hypothetical protein
MARRLISNGAWRSSSKRHVGVDSVDETKRIFAKADRSLGRRSPTLRGRMSLSRPFYAGDLSKAHDFGPMRKCAVLFEQVTAPNSPLTAQITVARPATCDPGPGFNWLGNLEIDPPRA